MGGAFSTSSAMAAFVATGLISLAPNVLLFLMPRYTSGQGGNASTFLSLGQAMGAGGLLGDVFLHTLPEIAYNETSGMFILIGFVFFFAADLLCRSTSSEHQHHSETKNQVDGLVSDSPAIPLKKSAIILNLFADSLHNYTDGLAIGASYSIIDKSTVAAVSTVWSTLKNHSRGGFAALSICFHEIPHELSKYRSMQLVSAY
jgi:zinc transporter ZupT